MTLALAVETSSVQYGIAVFDGREVIAHRTIRRDDPEFASVGDLAAAVLGMAGRSFGELGLLAVDVGPGNLTSVRAGVAYVNGLAFSVGCPVVGIDSLRLLAHQAVGRTTRSAVCLRNAGSGNVYAGLFAPDAAPVLRCGPLDSVVPLLARGRSELLAVGAFRDEVRTLLPDTKVEDTGIDTASVLTLHDLMTDPAELVPEPALVTSPLTDSSLVFSG